MRAWKRWIMVAATCAWALGLPAYSVQAATAPAEVDVKGGHDHPLIRRFDGSWLVGFKYSDWEQASFPTSMAVKDDQWTGAVTAEGRLTKAIYVSPTGKSPLEVFRNYERALVDAGFKRRFACESHCEALYGVMRQSDRYAAGLAWAKGSVSTPGGGGYSLDAGVVSSEDGRFWYGTLARNGQDIQVLVYTADASNNTTQRAATYLQVIEPKAMPVGQVKVDAQALERGLEADGRIALYGLYFDTGKADVKPESDEQLGEMAKLLQGHPALRVYVVGHTDNRGTLESNSALSQQRAQAVAKALVTRFKIDPARLTARGVASLAPLASNAAEEGRARNRRVEMVVQ